MTAAPQDRGALLVSSEMRLRFIALVLALATVNAQVRVRTGTHSP